MKEFVRWQRYAWARLTKWHRVSPEKPLQTICGQAIPILYQFIEDSNEATGICKRCAS